MAVIRVTTYDASNGAAIPGTELRTGSPRDAVDHALDLSGRYPAPGHVTRIRYAGEFVEPAFTELAELAQKQGLEVEIDGA